MKLSTIDTKLAAKRAYRPATRLDLKATLHKMAKAKGPGAKLPTVRELCEMFETNKYALDEALKELETQNVISRKQGSGIYVSPKIHCKNILVLINSNWASQIPVSPFWGILWNELVQEGQRRKSDNNEEVIVQLITPDRALFNPLPPDVMLGMENGQLHGLLTVGLNVEDSEDWKISSDTPMVSYGGVGHWQITVDYESAVAESVRRMAGLGCRKIGFMRPSWYYRRASKYEEKFYRLLESNSVAYYPELCRYGILAASEIKIDPWKSAADLAQREPQYEGCFADDGFIAAMRVFEDSGAIRPDGLIIHDDRMTSGVLRALQELGIRPGEDIIIASHTNIGSPILHGLESKLLLWMVDSAEIAKAMFALLDKLMAGERPANNPVVLEPHLAN